MFLRKILGPLVSIAIMPSQRYSQERGGDVGVFCAQGIDGLKMSHGVIDSTNGAKIDFCQIESDLEKSEKNIATDIRQKKLIVHAFGNGDFYENHLVDIMSEAKKYPNTIVVGFNFRNVIKSTGWVNSEQDWIDDAKAVIDHFRGKGIKTENILLGGHSLGGAIVTMAAAQMYKAEKENAKANGVDVAKAKSVKLINNRSFSDLATEIMALILGKYGTSAICGLVTAGLAYFAFGSGLGLAIGLGVALTSSPLVVPKLTQMMLKPFIQLILWSCFGTMDALSAYKSLPDEAKDHIMAKDDSVIPEVASLHHGLKATNSLKKEKLKAEIAAGDQSKEAVLKDLKDCKVQYTPQRDQGMKAHNVSLVDLRTYHKVRNSENEEQISGEDVMDNKIKKLLKI